MSYKPVTTHGKLMKKIMVDPEARAEYEAFSLHLELAEQLKKHRKMVHMTQEEVALSMHAHKPTISRLESAASAAKHSPSIMTLFKYADAVGCELKIILIPKHKSAKNKKS